MKNYGDNIFFISCLQLSQPQFSNEFEIQYKVKFRGRFITIIRENVCNRITRSFCVLASDKVKGFLNVRFHSL